VKVDPDAQTGPADFAHGGHPGQDRVDFFMAVDVVQLFSSVQLDGLEAAGQLLFDRFGDIVRRSPPIQL
jgi:hypothetical protein